MGSAQTRHPMTLTQKILAAHARNLPRPWVQAGDVLQVSVDWTIASELAWNGMERTYSMLGRPKLHDKDRFFLAVDHTVDPVTLANDKRAQKLVQLSRTFAKESGIRHFYDANQTILHTRFYRDLVRPGDLVLGADSHTSSHGGLGAVSIGLGGADIVVAMVLGSSWIQVPEAIAIEYRGKLPFGIAGKDVILRTLGLLGRNTVAMERSVEYRGEGIRQLSTDSRFAIANMTAEFGGLNGIFEADEVTAAWLAGRADVDDPLAVQPMRSFRADADAPYARKFEVDLSQLEPQVAVPFSPDNVKGVTELAGTELQGLFIGACTTTEEELVLARWSSRPLGYPAPRTTSRSWSPAICPSRRISAAQACGPPTSGPGSASIRRAARCASPWPRARRGGERSGSLPRTATSRTGWATDRSRTWAAPRPWPPARRR